MGTMYSVTLMIFDVATGFGVSDVCSSPVQQRRQFYRGRTATKHTNEHGILLPPPRRLFFFSLALVTILRFYSTTQNSKKEK